jgi:hypothetical protein
LRIFVKSIVSPKLLKTNWLKILRIEDGIEKILTRQIYGVQSNPDPWSCVFTVSFFLFFLHIAPSSLYLLLTTGVAFGGAGAIK